MRRGGKQGQRESPKPEDSLDRSCTAEASYTENQRAFFVRPAQQSNYAVHKYMASMARQESFGDLDRAFQTHSLPLFNCKGMVRWLKLNERG